jgi:lysophospholipase L1-like esterase
MLDNGRSGVWTAIALVAFVSVSLARPPAETGRPVGVVDQVCSPAVPAATDSKDIERLLDPSAGREFDPPDPAGVAVAHTVEEDRLHSDWASLCRYHAENAALRHATSPRVVFMGDSITEYWKLAHPEFFGESFIDRGVTGQTTEQMLVRFRQDVIALKPAVVHILGGTNDFAGNGGPTTLDAIKNNIESMVDLATANDIRVVIGSVPPAGAFPWRPSVVDPAPQIVEINDWLRRFAKEKNLIYVDYHDPLADERDAMKQTFSNDGVHPNRDGYSVMEPLARHAIDLALANNAGSSPHNPASKPPRQKDSGPRS